MVEKVSTRKGNNSKGAQKYQNTFKFKHNKNSKTTKKILTTPIGRVCVKCKDILQWRKDFRKYKPLTIPKKCVRCDEKAVKEAYHVICSNCSINQKVCPKCLTSNVGDAFDDELNDQSIESESSGSNDDSDSEE